MKTPQVPASARTTADTRILRVRFEKVEKFCWFVLIHHQPIMLLFSVTIIVGAAMAGSLIAVPFAVLGVGLLAAVLFDANNPDRRLHDDIETIAIDGNDRVLSRGRLRTRRID